MTSDEAAAAGGGTVGHAGSLPFDTSKPHQARIYDHLLGGKDNISQVVQGTPHTALTVAIQARYGNYSKTASSAVRCLFDTCMGIGVRFSGRGFLTVA
jgi:S-adenosyl methyltransferase